ncbi:MAG: hypothetical protein IJ184_06850 [Alphaproteobacteria bacterium]|nr:hypothetical protein [Alphaproteobacteria bacterium]
MLNIVIDLKKKIKENFGIELHFHDTCGGMYFSVDEKNEQVSEYIENYFKEREKKLKYRQTD